MMLGSQMLQNKYNMTEWYKVYKRADLRENCDCGKCIDKRGFRNSLRAWHAVPLLFTDKLYKVKDIVCNNEELIIFKALYDGRFNQLYDYSELVLSKS